jgi:type IV secretory pathway protease TraF
VVTVSTKPLAVPNTVDKSTPLPTKELCRSSAHRGMLLLVVSKSSGFVRRLAVSMGRAS